MGGGGRVGGDALSGTRLALGSNQVELVRRRTDHRHRNLVEPVRRHLCSRLWAVTRAKFSEF